MVFKLLLTILAVYRVSALFGMGEVQTVRVNGTIYCDGKPARDVRLKLYDDETWKTDDLMGESKTDEEGDFDFEGSDKQKNPLNPKLNIYHLCGPVNGTLMGSMLNKTCYKKLSMPISQFAIVTADHSNNTFEVGKIRLNSSEPFETDCFN